MTVADLIEVLQTFDPADPVPSGDPVGLLGR
jgi:putative NIF3 family GTP cyclohydrolase 1 type 2